MIHVTDLFYYPIKSCAGIRVDSAELTPTGLKHDRMLLITTPEGEFLTQRIFPRMALIRPKVTDTHLTLDAPGMQSITVPIQRDGDSHPVTIWRDMAQAVSQGVEANQWVSEFLQADLRLVAMANGFERRVDPGFAQPSDIVSFADGYAILVISQASLDILNEKLDEPIGMERFRPNIVVTGSKPHAEDTWHKFHIGDVPFSGVKPCARCKVVTVDQQTGIMGREPNRTLAGYRRFPRGVMFGMNLIHHKLGTISIGDTLSIEDTHAESWIKREDYRPSRPARL